MAITKVTGDLIETGAITAANLASGAIDTQVQTYLATNNYAQDFTINTVSTNTTAVTNNLYVLTASITLTLPATPSQGDVVYLINRSDTTTPIVARNGSNIMGAAEDFTVDVVNASLEFVYSDASNGWIII